MAVVIIDAGPLIALAKADLLFVPQRLFSRCRIPKAVWSECRRKQGEDSRRIERAVEEGWLRVKPAMSTGHYPPSLGRGEIEAMQLAVETGQALLVLDDRLARREAKRRRLDYIGTARMLLLAEHESIIDDAEAVTRRMSEHGYRISPSVVQRLR